MLSNLRLMASSVQRIRSQAKRDRWSGEFKIKHFSKNDQNRKEKQTICILQFLLVDQPV